MNHKVLSVQRLHDSADNLYFKYVVGTDSASADSILHNLLMGIENLKANWKGRDAGYRIQEVVKVHNAMVTVRNALAELAVASSKVAFEYREIQNANGAAMDTLNYIGNSDTKTVLGDYSDNADTIDINTEVNTGKNYIDTANSSIGDFATGVQSLYNELMDNWTKGPGRDDAFEAFQTFMNNVAKYQQTLAEVSNNIATALQNYMM